MRRRIAFIFTLPVLLAATLILTAPAANAASPHFKKGGTPTCTFAGTTSIPVTCNGVLAGLGNDDLNLHLAVSGFALYQCQNGGGNIAPGQNRVLVGPATSDTAIPASAIKNGNLAFTTNPATLTADPTVPGSVAGCPNPNWTGVNPVVTLTSISLDIFQPVTTQIFHCTASNPDGLTSPVTLSC
ncbi:MAG TPA: hypothetical protein VKG85_02480 [Actinomycetes bacterium]|nr:hypothetical protein [Actinomycetes bacterium]